MANKYPDKRFPQLVRVAQNNSYYCGPASLQMLLSNLNIIIDQQQVVDSLQINDKIVSQGMTIQELGLFVKEFYPQVQFWFKFNSTTNELSRLVNDFQLPVGVEWQGIFDYPDDEVLEDEDDDPGHLAVITGINTQENYVYMADPDTHYAGTDRKFSILQFDRRWWDINTIIDPISHRRQEIDDNHGLFLVTPAEFSFPVDFQLIKP